VLNNPLKYTDPSGYYRQDMHSDKHPVIHWGMGEIDDVNTQPRGGKTSSYYTNNFGKGHYYSDTWFEWTDWYQSTNPDGTEYRYVNSSGFKTITGEPYWHGLKGGGPNLTNRVGNADYGGYVIDGFGYAAELSAKSTFKYGQRINGIVKSAAQLTAENAALMGKIAIRLNVAGALVGTYDCTAQGLSDYQNGNVGLAAYEYSKAFAYTSGIFLIAISPFTGGTTAIIGGNILLGTGLIDIGGDVSMYFYGGNK
jgi:hypothetical protein